MAKSTHTVGGTKLDAGDVANPSSSYKDEVNTGWFKSDTNKLDATTAGASRLTIENGRILVKVNTEIPVGSLGDLPFRFDGDTNTGIYRPSADKIGFVVGGVEMMQVHSGGATINNTLSVPAIVGPGTVPLGAIIPIASNLAGAMSIAAATNAVDGNGFQYCNGAAFGAGAALSGAPIYDLTDERFLAGSTAAGVTGGNNTAQAAISGTQSISHSHSVDYHSHDMYHVHQWGVISSYSSGLMYTKSGIDLSSSLWDAGDFNVSKFVDDSSVYTTTGSSSAMVDGPMATLSGARMFTGGVAAGPSGVGSSSKTGGSAPGTSSDGGSIDFSNATSSTVNNRPSYISVQYVMRVK